MSPQRSSPSKLIRYSLAALLASGTARAQSVLPTGGHVVAGGAAISAPAGNNLTVTQTTARAVVNWNGFSVGPPNAVTFNQPGSTAAILNRVTGSTPSTIAGEVSGNGQVYLVNPNGVAITPTGSVQVGGGFVASSLGISNQDFMGGNLGFTGNGASAPVSNAGTITAGPGGFVGLIGGTAANSGTIAVPLGRVGLGSGEAATLDLNGGGFLQVAVPTGATTAAGQALVSNSGAISAAGGTVELRAATVATAIRDAVNLSGTVAATSATGQNGSITLSGGPGGAVNVTGTLDASAPATPTAIGGPASTGAGGTIMVDGAKVRLGHHAILNASGAKGGTVLVGVSGPNGQGEADTTTIADGATILATGGGHIETSGKRLKLGQALIDAGIGGSWLTDPTNLTIDATAATTISNTLNLGSDVIEQTTGTGASGSGNGSSGAGDIIVDGAIAWSTPNTLTLSAFNGITVNAPITINGTGNLVLTTNNNINGTSTGNGMLAFVPGLGSAQFTAAEGSGQTLTINGSAYTLLYNMGEVQNIGPTGSYALAIPLNAATDPTTPASWSPIGEGTAFTGSFSGLGNTISNLTISDSGDGAVGLFGQLGAAGTISNFGLVGGSVTGAASTATIGGLVGTNRGAIVNAYTTGTVAGGSGSTIDGGLVGSNESTGTITNSYATGAVSGGDDNVGGLVGQNIGGAITRSFATGAVSGDGNGSVGGLVGYNFVGTITDAYATGMVSGGNGASVGGLLGTNFSGTVTDAYATGAVSGSGASLGGLIGTNSGTVTDGYYDAGTTGMPLGMQSDGSVGMTTAAFQTALPNFQNPASWGVVAGESYPYLCWQAFGCLGTPQVVAGTVYEDTAGTTAAGPGITLIGIVNGTQFTSLQSGGTVVTGANGYYYYLLAPNTIGPSDAVLTYAQSYPAGIGTTSGAAFSSPGGATTGLDIFADTLHAVTSESKYSLVQQDLTTAIGGNGTAATIVSALDNLQVDAHTAIFDVDSAISYPVGTVSLNAAGGITESTGPIIADSLAIIAVGNVDLPGANLVNVLAANVTGLGATFDFSNAQALTIGTVGSLSGVTTNGTDGSAANIVLQTTTGDLDIEEPVSTNGANGLVLGLSQGLIGLQAAGNMVMNSSGSGDAYLVAYGVEAIAGGNILLDGASGPFGNRIGGNDDSDHTAQTAGTFAALATGLTPTPGTGPQIVFNTGDAPLTVGTVGVTAGSITLPTVSGVTSNGGEIDLSSTFVLSLIDTFGVTLNQPVSANNFLSGAPTTVLQGSPGLVSLIAEAGGVTQIAGGAILAGRLYAEADLGSVTLTAANRIGANDDTNGIAAVAGIVAGAAQGDFKLVNHNAPLTVGEVSLSCGCVETGIQASFGDIDLATTGAGAIEVDELMLAGNNVNIAVAPGDGFTNATGFGSGIGAFGAVTILADQMSLSGGQIVAGGVVVLAPATPTNNIVLGGAGGPGTLTLQQADLDGIESGAIQIGYRNVDGTPSLTGNITIAGDITIDTDFVTGFLLVTGGSVTEAGGGIIGTGPVGLQLGIMASGTNTLTASDNNIGRLAAFIDGTDPSLTLTNAARLRVGTLDGFTAGISFDGDGFPNPMQISNSSSDPLSGITTWGGASTTGGVTLTTTTGGITVFAPISAGAQPIALTAAGAIAFNNSITTTGALTATAGTDGGSGEGITQNSNGLLLVSGGAILTDQSPGGAITLTDSNSLGGTVSLNTNGTGGTATLVNGIALTLGASTLGDNLTVSATDGITVTGAVSSPGTIALNAIVGSGAAPMLFASGADVAAPTIDLNATSIALTGTAILGQTGATIDLANTSSTGGVTEDTTAQIVAASLEATNGLTGAASLLGTGNAVQSLGAITVSGGGNGFALVTATPLDVAGGLTTDAGAVSLTTTGAGSNLSLDGPILASGAVVTLNSSGTVTQSGAAPITASALTGDSVGGATLTATNAVASLDGWTDTDAGAGSSGFSFIDGQPLATTGTISSPGSIQLSTTGLGSNLSLDAPISTPNASVTLTSAGTVTQAVAAPITAVDLNGSSVGGAALTATNEVEFLSGWADTGVGSAGFSFTDGQAVTTLGTVSSTGPIALTTTGTGSTLSFAGNVSAPGNTVTLTSSEGIDSTDAAVITANVLTGSSAGGTQLPGPNQVAVFGPFTDTAGEFIVFNNAQSFAVAGTLSTTGQIILSTSAPGANLTFGNGGGAADGTVTTNSFVQLLIDGTITQASGTITGSSLSGSSVGGASLTKANVIAGLFGPFTNTGSGDVSFTNAGGIVIAGVTNTVGNITLTTTSGDMGLDPTTAVAASPTGTVTLVSGGGIFGSGTPGTYATISGGSLSVTAVGSVDLPGANMVNTLAANVTGAGASFDFSNAQTLTVGTVGTLSGVTTNGTDGSEANIVLQTTAGDLYINQPVSTNGANGTTLGLSLGEIGLQAAGKLILDQSGSSGNLIGFAVEAIAGDTLNLDSGGNRIGGNDVGGVAQTAGTFSGETTGAGAVLVFGDADAPLTIDQVPSGGGQGVAAGSMSLPLISGVYSNGGTIALTSEQSRGNGPFGLTLNQPVNANNFVGGFPSTVLQESPGLVELFAEVGDVTQTSTGVVLGGQLFVESFTGSVVLTAANRLGANDSGGIAQTAGLLAGAAENDFKFVNANAPLTIDALSCSFCEGIFAGTGGIDLATTGAGALTVNKPVNSGVGINIAVAPGYGFTNNASDDLAFDSVYTLTGTPGTAGLDSSFAGAPITILADQMSLSGGTINTGGAPLVLGPVTPTTNIVLSGGAVPAGTLGLQAADFAGVQAGLVQIGYRNPDGTVSMSGNITIAGNLAINTANIGELMLMTGGSVNETGSGAISGTGSGSLELGVIASGANSLNGGNNIGTLAASIDGANPTLSFTSAGALSVGALSNLQAGVSLDTDGFPNPTPLAGAAANPLSGVTAAGGVTLTTGANLTIADPISAPGKAVTLVAGGTITQASGATITAASLSGSSVGNTTLTEPNAVGSLGPFTATGGALAFDDTVNLTIGGALSGTSIVLATIGPDPNLVISANMTAPTVALSATGSITQNGGTTIVATNLTAATQLDAGGAISLGSASNQVTGNVTLTSLNFAGTQLAGGAITFNDNTGFTIASLGGLQGGVGTTAAASLTAGGTIGEASGATISAGTLSGASAGGATLSGANLVANLGAWADTGPGSAGLTLADSEALTVAPGSAVSSATGPVTLAVTGGNLTLGAASAISGNGVVLATTGDFINNAGAGALAPNPGSRWLVYSAAPAGDNFGNLDSGDTAIWNATYASLPPASVTQGGDRYVFAQGQTLTVTTTNGSKTYGTDGTALVANDFTVTGYATGVANAYLGDTAATAYTGAPSVVSTGSAPTATVAGGPYAITTTAGTMAGADGYAVTFANGGSLTVTPATLTAGLTGAVTKVYDGTNVAALATGNYTLTGIVNGDTVTLNDPTTGTYATANAGTGIGVMVSGLTIGGSGVGNYTLASTAASANIGTITPEPLTVAANNLTRQAGQPNPVLTYTLTAGTLFGGDALSGALATAATPLSPVGSTFPITEGSLAAPSANYALAFVDGVLTIVAVANTGASPLMYVDIDWGAPGNTDTGGPNPGLTPCTPGNIAAQLTGTGQATLYGAGGCGGNL